MDRELVPPVIAGIGSHRTASRSDNRQTFVDLARFDSFQHKIFRLIVFQHLISTEIGCLPTAYTT